MSRINLCDNYLDNVRHDGILPVDPQRSVELVIAGRKLGAHFLQWMRGLPGEEFGGPVLLRFTRQPGRKKKRPEANAWLSSLVPLKLHERGEWDPAEEYWGEAGEPMEAWVRPIIKRGRRPMFEMEQVLPGADPEDFDSDPILEANELRDRRKIAKARQLLDGSSWSG